MIQLHEIFVLCHVLQFLYNRPFQINSINRHVDRQTPSFNKQFHTATKSAKCFNTMIPILPSCPPYTVFFIDRMFHTNRQLYIKLQLHFLLSLSPYVASHFFPTAWWSKYHLAVSSAPNLMRLTQSSMIFSMSKGNDNAVFRAPNSSSKYSLIRDRCNRKNFVSSGVDVRCCLALRPYFTSSRSKEKWGSWEHSPSMIRSASRP